jgi:hypothetical protein
MTVTDRMRTDLHGCLDGLMGNEMADIMMELLPPVGWGEVVRRQDVAQMRSDLHSEIVALRVELKIEIAEVRAELKAEIADVRAEVAELRTEVRLLAGQVQSLANDIKRLNRAMTALTGGVITFGVMVITMLFQVS